MPCYSPLHCWKGKSKDAGKIKVVWRKAESWKGEQLDLPCGQCIGCRLERSRQWAVRCMHEASLYDKNCFLTLTYDDEHLPADGSLHLDHFQKFMKRLRRRYEASAKAPIRFFHCGEYGEVKARPHYHALLFNHSFSDRKFFKWSGDARLYTSSSLSELWPMGHALSGDVSFESAAYVARYALKKVTGDLAAGHYQGRRPEYVTMSRRPGIGRGWIDKFGSDVYPADRVVVRGRETRPPRFYDSWLEVRDPLLIAQLKLDRANNEHFVEDVLEDGRRVLVSDSSTARLGVKEVVKLAEISTLKRSLE